MIYSGVIKLKVDPSDTFIIHITAQGAMRMVRGDSWLLSKSDHQLTKDRAQRRDRIIKYHDYRETLVSKLESIGFEMPECNYWLRFYLPMPDSWSQKKKDLYRGQKHQQKPDKDNLEKAFIDAIFYKTNKNDSCIWDGRVSKYWDDEGRIEIEIYNHESYGNYKRVQD